MKKKSKKIIRINRNRRKFLKLIAFGGVSLLAMKFFGSKALALASSASAKSASSSKKDRAKQVAETDNSSVSGKDINMVENDNGVVFVDRRTGEEIFILEKD
ncbi:MAG: hypothetical protein PHS16_03030 [Candidatus Colwellbacteria bacterium]|jgi:hypothetical protein|nr:hypothetical protein [Candidatus Colwellbacteria bacterium]MCK9497379.1 hypothetical protein [Candidatus Colwellbacteria bacterium]MDD3752877.1 hypothetical protein [Candidatus Colwellbacteria bacterium]